MLTNVSSENRLILPRVRSEMRGWLTFRRLAAVACVSPSFSMNFRRAVIISDRNRRLRDSAGEKPRSVKTSPLPFVIFVPRWFRISSRLYTIGYIDPAS